MIKYNPDIHHRRSIRLKGYDYSRRGHYFITICTQNRLCLFGDIENGAMESNDAGRMMFHWYAELENKFQGIRCDTMICMPNHIHFIVYNTVGADLRVRPGMSPDAGPGMSPDARPVISPGVHPGIPPVPRPDTNPNVQPDQFRENGQIDTGAVQAGQTHRSAPTVVASASEPVTVGTVVQWFKTMTTNAYIRGVKQNGWTRFPGKLWQRNYWEHIVRNDDELQKIRYYITNNPKNWVDDKLNGGVGNRVMEAIAPYDHRIWMV